MKTSSGYNLTVLETQQLFIMNTWKYLVPIDITYAQSWINLVEEVTAKNKFIRVNTFSKNRPSDHFNVGVIRKMRVNDSFRQPCCARRVVDNARSNHRDWNSEYCIVFRTVKNTWNDLFEWCKLNRCLKIDDIMRKMERGGSNTDDILQLLGHSRRPMSQLKRNFTPGHSSTALKTDFRRISEVNTTEDAESCSW